MADVDRRPERLAALGAALEAAQLDALLLTSLPNIRYLTGFSGSSAIVVATPREIAFITDFRYATQVKDEVGDFAHVSIEPQSLWAGLWRVLPQLGGLEVIGFESAHLLHRDFERLLSAGSRWLWRPTVDLVETLRERKDSDEIRRIADAAGVAERALATTVSRVRIGMTELEVAGLLEQALRDEGSEAFPFPTIVASGPRAALPHAHSSERETRRGDFLLIDYGAVVAGYCSDITRTFVLGAATDEQAEVYDVVREANARATRAVHAGMRGCDADAVAREYIEERGYGEQFGHSLGHGIGLEVHEAPRLAKTAEAPLPQGAVVTIEPGIYRAGWGGVRIEDDVVLGPSGPQLLTTAGRDLVEIP
ncbi:MAG TPA: aminopeptidase P family protein [Gemmatimonadaceae bacterium]